MKAPMLSRGPPRGGSGFREREKSGVQTETEERGGHFSHGPGADPEAQARHCPLHALGLLPCLPYSTELGGNGEQGGGGPSSRPRAATWLVNERRAGKPASACVFVQEVGAVGCAPHPKPTSTC